MNAPLTPAELAELIRLTPKGRASWTHRATGERARIEHDGTALTVVDGNPLFVLECERRRHERRSVSAKKAAATRARRVEQEIYRLARLFLEGRKIAPSTHCAICNKAMDDSVSVARGVGPDCWGQILLAMESQRMDNANAAAVTPTTKTDALNDQAGAFSPEELEAARPMAERYGIPLETSAKMVRAGVVDTKAIV